MSTTDVTHESVPQESITSDNYLIQLLREEEVIEAIRMVDSEKASEMSRDLEQDLQEPWTYLNKSNKIPIEQRLNAFQKLKKESEEAHDIQEPEEAPDIEEPTALTEDNPPHSTAALIEHSPPCNHHLERISIKNPHLVRPPSHNGEYPWSRRFREMIQELERAAEDALTARDKPLSNAISHGTLGTPETPIPKLQYEEEYTESVEHWKVPEELKYRPFDAVSAFADHRRERSLRIAAKKMAIVVTQDSCPLASDSDQGTKGRWETMILLGKCSRNLNNLVLKFMLLPHGRCYRRGRRKHLCFSLCFSVSESFLLT